MAESLVQVTEGSGKKLHTFNRTVGANSVEDEIVLQGEQDGPTYVASTGATVSLATANDHILQLMAGASLNVFVRSIRLYQVALATTTTIARFELLRVTTAGTGGTAITPTGFDSADGVSGAAAMSLPTVKGTESSRLGVATGHTIQTLGTGGGGLDTLLTQWDFDDRLRSKTPRINSGTTNGIVVKSLVAIAAATVVWEVTFVERNFA